MEENINMENLPKHIAVIMDGNRRWAKREGLDTPSGHKEGAENLKRIAKYANKIGIKYLTVYAFSTENWKRSEIEVTAIMKIIKYNLMDFFISNADKNNIKIRIIGRLEEINTDLRDEMYKVMEKTKDNTGLVLNIAFNYGGRDEITYAMEKIAKKLTSGEIKIDDINQDLISDNLFTAGQPDPDLVIRTSGEERISNFLLWQIAYSEFIFSNKYWPEFSENDLLECIESYQKRTRRFGGNS